MTTSRRRAIAGLGLAVLLALAVAPPVQAGLLGGNELRRIVNVDGSVTYYSIPQPSGADPIPTGLTRTSWRPAQFRVVFIHQGGQTFRITRRADPARWRVVRPAPQPTAPPVTQPPVPASSELAALEQQLLELVNAERRAVGVAPLSMDPGIARVARLKSEDMVRLGYFAHQSPTYGSPFAMMRQFGIDFRLAGENLAHAASIESAHRALMNSPGHRANILNPRFTQVGIGVATGSTFGLKITQMFVGR